MLSAKRFLYIPLLNVSSVSEFSVAGTLRESDSAEYEYDECGGNSILS